MNEVFIMVKAGGPASRRNQMHTGRASESSGMNDRLAMGAGEVSCAARGRPSALPADATGCPDEARGSAVAGGAGFSRGRRGRAPALIGPDVDRAGSGTARIVRRPRDGARGRGSVGNDRARSVKSGAVVPGERTCLGSMRGRECPRARVNRGIGFNGDCIRRTREGLAGRFTVRMPPRPPRSIAHVAPLRRGQRRRLQAAGAPYLRPPWKSD